MQKIAYVCIYAAYFRLCDHIFSIFLVQHCLNMATKIFGSRQIFWWQTITGIYN